MATSFPSDPSAGGSPVRWLKISSELLVDCRVVRINRERWGHPGRGTEGDFVSMDAPDWVLVVAVTTEGELVLVRQFRFGSSDLSLEVPGGVADPGESDPVATARRELLEETGYLGGEAWLAGTVFPNPALQRNRCHFVIIDGVHPTGTQQFDEHEDIVMETLPVARVLELARNGGITHALAVTALFFFEAEWRRRGRLV
jgi:ADP-ribose pyrophosphatase